jgi:hypothetical protein
MGFMTHRDSIARVNTEVLGWYNFIDIYIDLIDNST